MARVRMAVCDMCHATTPLRDPHTPDVDSDIPAGWVIAKPVQSLWTASDTGILHFCSWGCLSEYARVEDHRDKVAGAPEPDGVVPL